MLESESAIHKSALWAFTFKTLVRAGVDFAALDAVVNDLHPLGFVEVFIPLVVVEPEAEYQEKASTEIEEKKEIYFQADHTGITTD